MSATTMADAIDGSQPYSRKWWLAKLSEEEFAHKDFRRQATQAWKAYNDDSKQTTENPKEFVPIFWANIQITHGALYARTPKPDVRKRYKEMQVPKTVPQAVERVLSFILDQESIDAHAHRCVDDFLVASLGVGKVQFEASIDAKPVTNPADGSPVMGADGKPMVTKTVGKQRFWLEYLPWKFFHWEPCKDWEDCDWIAIDWFLTPDEVKARWPKAKDLKGTMRSSTDNDSGGNDPNEGGRPTIWVVEIWCRKTRKVHWIAKDCDDIDETLDDPLGLEQFYPIPRPMVMNLRTGKYLPKPEYTYIQPLCRDIDNLTKRMVSITDSIRAASLYDPTMTELSELEDADDGKYVAVANLLERLGRMDGRTGWDAVLLSKDNAPAASVLAVLSEQRGQRKSELFELTGISDIVRGSSDPRETKGAQQIKGQWANVRMAGKQSALDGFFRDMFRMFATIASKKLTDENWKAMTGMQLSPEELQTLRSDVSRNLAIDVETDSTIMPDNQQEQAQRLEVTSTFMQYAPGVLPMMQQGQVPANIGKEVLLLAIGGLKYAQNLIEAIESLPDNMQQLGDMQQQVQQGQQQAEQMQQQMAEMQKQLEQHQAQEQARLDAEAQSDIEAARVKDENVQADTELKRMQAAKAGVDAQHTIVETMGSQVRTARESMTPIKDPNAPPPVRAQPIPRGRPQ